MATAFQPPRGVFCANRKNTKPVPIVPEHFSFSSEIVEGQIETVRYMQEFYDMRAKLSRFDYRPQSSAETPFAPNPLREVHDFSNGIRYVTDRFYGNCTVLPIDRNGLDSLPSGSDFVVMRNNSQFFYLDDSYVYIGTQKTRNIDSETWQSTRTDYPNPDGQLAAIFEWSFMAQDWNDTAGSYRQGSVPVRLAITMLEASISLDYNIFDFKSDTPSVDDFNVAACYKDSQKRRFRLTFNGSYDTVIGYGGQIFYYEAYDALTTVMNVSSLRIADMKILNGVSQFYLYFSVMDVPPIKGDVEMLPPQTPLNDSVTLLYLAAITGNLNFTGFDVTSGELVVTVIRPTDVREVDASGATLPINAGIKNGTLPKPPDKFQMKVETVLPKLFLMSNTLAWYDYSMKLFRFDSEDTHRGHRISELHDFGTGVSYIKNTYFGNCSVAPITLDGVDTRPDGQFVAIRDPAQMFNFDVPYTYLGVGEMRGVDADMWTAERNDWPIFSPSKSVWTWYWSTGSWLSMAGEAYEYQVPMALTIESSQPEFSSMNYLYDFRQEGFDIISVSIEECYSFSHKKHFKFSLTGVVGQKIDGDPVTFKYLAVASLSTYCDVSPLRISDVEYIRSDSEVVLIFTLLDRAPVQGSVKFNLTEVSLDDAANKFLQKASAGQLVLYIYPDNPQDPPVAVTGYNASELLARPPPCDGGTTTSSSLTSTSTSTSRTVPTTSSTSVVSHSSTQPVQVSNPDDEKFTTGTVAGIAAGSAAAGILLGIVLVIIFLKVYRRRRNYEAFVMSPSTRNPNYDEK